MTERDNVREVPLDYNDLKPFKQDLSELIDYVFYENSCRTNLRMLWAAVTDGTFVHNRNDDWKFKAADAINKNIESLSIERVAILTIIFPSEMSCIEHLLGARWRQGKLKASSVLLEALRQL